MKVEQKLKLKFWIIYFLEAENCFIYIFPMISPGIQFKVYNKNAHNINL